MSDGIHPSDCHYKALKICLEATFWWVVKVIECTNMRTGERYGRITEGLRMPRTGGRL